VEEITMPIEKWSEAIFIVHLADDPQFSEDLAGAAGAVRRNAGIVLDFGGVRYVNSSNISQLLKLRKQLMATESRLVLCALNTQVWGVFLITGLDKIFEFSDNVPTALATLQMG
jgi:anti-anti-sigma factor